MISLLLYEGNTVHEFKVLRRVAVAHYRAVRYSLVIIYYVITTPIAKKFYTAYQPLAVHEAFLPTKGNLLVQ